MSILNEIQEEMLSRVLSKEEIIDRLNSMDEITEYDFAVKYLNDRLDEFVASSSVTAGNISVLIWQSLKELMSAIETHNAELLKDPEISCAMRMLYDIGSTLDTEETNINVRLWIIRILARTFETLERNNPRNRRPENARDD